MGIQDRIGLAYIGLQHPFAVAAFEDWHIPAMKIDRLSNMALNSQPINPFREAL